MKVKFEGVKQITQIEDLNSGETFVFCMTENNPNSVIYMKTDEGGIVSLIDGTYYSQNLYPMPPWWSFPVRVVEITEMHIVKK